MIEGRITEEQYRAAGEAIKNRKGFAMLLHDTRDCCGLNREDYEQYLEENPVKTQLEIHQPCRKGAKLESIYNEWRRVTANMMTASFIENLKYSKIDYPLGICGSVEFDGKRYPVKSKFIKSEGEVIEISSTGKERTHFRRPSIYKSVMTCLSGKNIRDFTMQFIGGHFTIHVYHDRGVNVFNIYKIGKAYYETAERGNWTDGSRIFGVIYWKEIDFFD